MENTINEEGKWTIRSSEYLIRRPWLTARRDVVELPDGRICACPNIDRDRFSQGSIYTDNFYQVWEERFQPFRDRRWARTGRCADCKVWKNCLGNGMHNWHGDYPEVLQCHYAKTL